jgi:predicted permease
MADEVRFHLDAHAEDLVRSGVPRDEAARRARVVFGGVERVREECREARRLHLFDQLWQDLRYSARALRRDRGFALVAVFIVAIGIGANTTVFSVVNTILLRPLPFADPDALVWISNEYEGNDIGLSGITSRVAVFEEWQQRSRSLADLTSFNAFFAFNTHKLTGGGEPERLGGVRVAQNFFDLLGVRPYLGRAFVDEECQENGRRAVVLSHGLWQRRFASDPTIVGRPITLDDEPTVVVGVMPATFEFASVFAPGSQVDLFIPLVYDIVRNWGNTLAVIGRLAPDATIESAGSELDNIIEQLREERPEWGVFYGAGVSGLKAQINGRSRRALLVVWAAVGLVLLIVCANLSSLLLSRSVSRQKEIGLRAALGAGRGRLVSQLLTESLILASGGALIGLGAAWATTSWVSRLQAVSIPLLADVRLDQSALAFAALATVVTGVLFGLAPALQLSRQPLHACLKEGGRGTGGSARQASLRSALVVGETVLACVLLVGAGLLLRSFLQVLDVRLGFQPDQAVTLKIDPGPTYSSSAERAAFYEEAVRRVRSVPGVEAAGITDALPLDRDRAWGVRVEGQVLQPGQSQTAHVRIVGPQYFEAIGISLLTGRAIGPQDAPPAEPVAVVNETMANRLWPGQDPLNRVMTSGETSYRVVGVVGDVRHNSLEEETGMEMYLPIWRVDGSSADLVVRTSLPPAALASSLRNVLRALDPTLPVADFRPLTQVVERAISPRRFFVSLLSAFAAIALLLAALGIYGIISYGVTQRTQEIGVRMALGATARDVQLGVLRQTAALALAGAIGGLAGALVVGRAMRALLFGVSAVDPITLGGMVLLLASVACLAGYIPARRASRVDPMSALRLS